MADPFGPYRWLRKSPQHLGSEYLKFIITGLVLVVPLIFTPLYLKHCSGRYTYHATHHFGPFDLYVTAEPVGESQSIQHCKLSTHRNKERVEFDIDGSIVHSWAGDADDDSSPEMYVWTQSTGSGSYGTLHIYEWTGDLTARPLPDMPSRYANGYRGHDEFDMNDQVVIRRFPLYREDDPNAEPSGVRRELQYRLYINQWELDRVVER